MIDNAQLNKIIERVKDKITGVQGVYANGPTGIPIIQTIPTEEPFMQEIILRDIESTIADIEAQLKIHLSVKRKTDLPKSAEDFYRNKTKYNGQYGVGAAMSPMANMYPMWTDLNDEQKALYNNNPALYVNGDLPWEYFTREQKLTFDRFVQYAPNKIGPAEIQDGKGRTYIKLYERYVHDIHRIAVEIRNPAKLSLPYLVRTYSPGEYYIYPNEGGIVLYPAQAQNQGNLSTSTTSASVGYAIPNFPQALRIDYEFGMKELPANMIEAIALLTAVRVFETTNLMFTKGFLSSSIQGFSIQFGDGLYSKVIERYTAMANKILFGGSFNGGPLMTAW